MLEEFNQAAQTPTADPVLVAMANAKWQSELMAALVMSKRADQDVSGLCKRLEEITDTVATDLGMKEPSPQAKSLILQACAPLAAEEIRQTGKLTGQWKDAFTEAVKEIPAQMRLFNHPGGAATSLGMTLANHYAELFAAANRFAFLRHPAEVVEWASSLIQDVAQHNVDRLAPQGDTTPVYQNQLNAVRKVFLSVYESEADQWIPMLNKQPDIRNLCAEGIPLNGVSARFMEQAQHFQAMLGIEDKPTMGLGRG